MSARLHAGGGAVEPSTKPSRESLREVKREARERERARRRMQKQWSTTPRRRWAAPLAWLGTGAVVVLAAFLLLGPERLGLGGGDPDPTVDETASESATEQQPAASPPSPPAASSADPFAGSEVEKWANGAAAVVVPKPAEVGSFTPQQVEAAYQKARAYVLAASLDPKVLYQGRVEPVQATVGRRSAGHLGGLVVNASQNLSPASYATRFRPGVAPASDVVKGDVRMTAKVAPRNGEQVLTVRVASVFVYALRPADEDDTAPKLVTTRREVDLDFTAAGAGRVSKPELGEAHFVNTGEVCDVAPQRLGYLSVYFDEQPLGDAAPAPAYDVKDLDAKAPDAECFRDASG